MNIDLAGQPPGGAGSSYSERTKLIIAENLGIQYIGKAKKSDDFKSHTHNLLGHLFKREHVSPNEPFWALQDITFTGYAGDVLGVIGSNGAGKTTLCRSILGMLWPNIGQITVNGEVSSLLSLGAGFNPRLSGRDNIYLNGMMLGMSRRRLKELCPSIEEFSGLDSRFSNLPIKYYSNGMKARLGFSIAAALEAEIMVIDEVLGTGDYAFQKKAAKKMRELVSQAKMVVVVTHSVSFVEKYCNRAIWLEQGKMVAFGEPRELVARYKEFAAEKAGPKRRKMISLCKTESLAGSQKTIDAKDLGICFKIDRKPFWALKDVSFDVKENEIVGIIGPNGAGKTTLCRTLCGIYHSDRGNVSVYGNVNALLSFSAGFDRELNGLDNIYLNGMMLGIDKRRIKSLEREIIEFAELEKYIHKPVKYYSKGMRSRLGFSIASMLNPDILVVDEALSAGDIAFQEKAAARMQDMLGEAKSVVIVTHSLSIVEKLCTRAIWLQKGSIRFDGDPAEAVSLYKKATLRKTGKKGRKVKKDKSESGLDKTGERR